MTPLGPTVATGRINPANDMIDSIMECQRQTTTGFVSLRIPGVSMQFARSIPNN